MIFEDPNLAEKCAIYLRVKCIQHTKIVLFNYTLN